MYLVDTESDISELLQDPEMLKELSKAGDACCSGVHHRDEPDPASSTNFTQLRQFQIRASIWAFRKPSTPSCLSRNDHKKMKNPTLAPVLRVAV